VWQHSNNIYELFTKTSTDLFVVFGSLQTKFTAVSSSESKRGVQCMSWSGLGVWLAAQGSFRVLLFHASTYDQLLDINVGPAVAQKLQSLTPTASFCSVFIGC